jgi:hypothetical protein
MFKKSIDLNSLLLGGALIAPERIIMAEELLSKGYSISRLTELPPQLAKGLIGEASLSAARRLVKVGLIE